MACLAPSDRLRPLGWRLVVLLWTFVAGPTLDAELAEGVRPSASTALSLRARHISSPRARRRLAEALRLRIEAAKSPSPSWSVRVPVDQVAVLSCQAEITALANRIATIQHPRPRGVAIAHQLAFDGLSPLYWKPRGGEDAASRLADRIHAARRALEVSADFD